MSDESTPSAEPVKLTMSVWSKTEIASGGSQVMFHVMQPAGAPVVPLKVPMPKADADQLELGRVYECTIVAVEPPDE